MKKYKEKEHKKFVKYMRQINKKIGSDPYLGLGRFRMDLYSEQWFNFEDGSGCELHLTIKLSDAATGNTALIMCDNFDYRFRLFNYLNDFMIRCSTGKPGHYPPLNYIELNIDNIVDYKGERV